jgi:hypothetical protein
MTEITTEYLAAAGATAICIVKDRGGYGVQVGRNAAKLSNVVAVQWIDARLAASVARLARKNLDKRLTISGVSIELQRAAAMKGAQLTTDAVATSRAQFAAEKIGSYLSDMAKNGGLAEFNREYKRRREAAGGRFMSYKAAETRLRRALIARLAGRRPTGQIRSMFDEVFEVKKETKGHAPKKLS